MTGIDTNILFYSIDNSDIEKHIKGVGIVSEIFQNPNKYKISLQVLAELNSSVKRKKADAFSLSLQLTKALLSHPEIITHYSEKEFCLALTEEKLFDALIAYTYDSCGCTEVLTENTKDMPSIKGLKFINPFKK